MPTPGSIHTDPLKEGEERERGGERYKRVMSLQQILQDTRAAEIYYRLGRTETLQREPH